MINSRKGSRYLPSVSQPVSRFAIVAVAHLLVSCTSEITTGASETTMCRPAAAQKLVSRPTDDEIKFLTKASIVRRAKSGDVLSQDFREDRVTVMTDASGKVISARCG